MDPNVNLTEQLEIADRDWTGKDSDELTAAEVAELHDAHVRLCELVAGLDRWLSRSGFLPRRWERDGKKTT